MKIIALLFTLCVNVAYALPPAQITEHLQQYSTIAGKFKQQRYLRGMTVPIDSAGQFEIHSDKSLIWKMEKPFVSELHVSDNGIEQTYGDNRIPAAGSPRVNEAQIKLLLALLSGDTAKLSDYFTLQADGTSDHWQLTLQPKGTFLQHIFLNITVIGGHYVEKVILHEAQGDRTVLSFYDQTVKI